MFKVLVLATVFCCSMANAACVPPANRPTAAWVNDIVQSASVIMDAEVIQAEDKPTGVRARLRPMTLYKGPAQPYFTMALPPATDEIVTESYQGFGEPAGRKLFVVLYGDEGDYRTNVCTGLAAEQPAVHAALLRRLTSDRARRTAAE